jgi:hypothetical protein
MALFCGPFHWTHIVSQAAVTGLLDHTKQAKFQIQWPSDIETPVCSLLVEYRS